MYRRTFMVAAVIAGMVPMAFAQLSNTDKSFSSKPPRATTTRSRLLSSPKKMSTNDAYKTYAQMMIDDHTQAAQTNRRRGLAGRSILSAANWRVSRTAGQISTH